MSSFLRPLAYRHRWIYDSVTAISSLSVGGVSRLRHLGLEALEARLNPGDSVLDLCCGSGEAAAPWLAAGFTVTGLDIAPRALDLAPITCPKKPSRTHSKATPKGHSNRANKNGAENKAGNMAKQK